MERKRILFVSYYYPPAAGQALPGAQRSVKFIRYITRLEKYVLTVRPELYPDYFTLDHPASLPVNDETIIRTGVYDVFQLLVNLKNRLLGSGSSDSAEEYHATENATKKDLQGGGESPENPGRFQRFKDMISAILTWPDTANCWIIPAILAGRKLVREKNIHFVFATGKPWSALIAACFLKKKGGCLIIDFRDPWVENPFEVDCSGACKRVNAFFERKVVHKADYVLLNTEDLRREFLKRYPEKPATQFVTMTNGYDAADFSLSPAGDDSSRNSSSSLVLTHAGLLYGLRDPVSVFKALEIICNSREYEMIFRQLGDITLEYDYTRYTDLFARSSNVGFENIGQVPYSQCLDYLSRSDILLIIQPDTKTQIPSKLYEYIYLEKPILTITPLDGALAAMVQEYGFGALFAPEDVKGIAAYLTEQALEKQRTGHLHCNYPNRKRFDVKNITAELEQILLDGETTAC